MQGNPYKRDVPADLHQSIPGFHRLLHAQDDKDQHSTPISSIPKAQASSPPFPCPGAEGGWETKRRLGEANGSAPILHPRPFLHRRKQSASNAQVPQAARRFANALSDLCRVRTIPTTLIQLGGLKKKKIEGRQDKAEQMAEDRYCIPFFLALQENSFTLCCLSCCS